MSHSVASPRVDTLGCDGVAGHLRVPFHPCSASVARRQLRLWLSRHATAFEPAELEDLVDSAELVVSELVGNAIRHARPVVGGVLALRWLLTEGQLVISVTDGGSALVPHKVEASPQAQSGRGMAIIDAIAHRWWTERSGSEATVHALIAVA